MEIFTNEFKDLLSKQLEELTNVVKKDEASLYVSLKKNVEFRSLELCFTKDGRFIHGTPIVLSHIPYILKTKKIK